jgi:PhzF family phenazine biosynthesis protein
MRQWLIDAFAAAPFLGNGACVLEPFDAWPDAAWMQALAAENNQAETAFLRRTSDPARFDLRWFTPATEVKLCGHATLASGHMVFAELGLAAPEVAFDTQSGELRVRRLESGYEMDFPADPPTLMDCLAGFPEALGVRPQEIWAGQYVVALLESEAAVRALRPDLAAIKDLWFPELHAGAGMVGVTALADPGQPYDVVSRFFAPGAGIPEDPATGSLHCLLSPLFSSKLGRPSLKFHQAFPGRGGDLDCEHRGERVLLRGAAATVLEGRLRI